MRIAQLTISVLGLVLLAVAVYELAGPRAATIAMWVMAVEPTMMTSWKRLWRGWMILVISSMYIKIKSHQHLILINIYLAPFNP